MPKVKTKAALQKKIDQQQALIRKLKEEGVELLKLKDKVFLEHIKLERSFIQLKMELQKEREKAKENGK